MRASDSGYRLYCGLGLRVEGLGVIDAQMGIPEPYGGVKKRIAVEDMEIIPGILTAIPIPKPERSFGFRV